MVSQHHKKLINCLRKDSRKPMKDICMELGMSINNVYCIKHELEKETIKKYTVLLDFKKIGYSIRVFFFLQPSINHMQGLRMYLESCSCINNLSFSNDYCSFSIEAIFKDSEEFSRFLDSLKAFSFYSKECLHLEEEIKKEDFLL